METLNKKASIVIVLLVVILAGIGFTLKTGNIPGVVGGGISLDKYVISSSVTPTAPVFMTPGTATSTLTMSTSNSKHIDLNIKFTASSSLSVLNYKVYFSNDDGASKSWYAEDNYTVSGITTTHASTTVTNTWIPATTVAQYKNVAITPVASKYTKVEFSNTIAGGALYVEGITQSDVNN